jgi:hypothetical protein
VRDCDLDASAGSIGIQINSVTFSEAEEVFVIAGDQHRISISVPSNSYLITLDAPSGQLLTAETIAEMTDGWVSHLTVVDSDGTVLLTDLEFTSYDSSTRGLTCVCTDETLLDLAEEYLVFGSNATTHSQLPDVAERYLREYMALRIQMRDSNTESVDTSSVLRALEEEILESIANLEEDIPAIPILDTSYLNYDSDL